MYVLQKELRREGQKSSLLPGRMDLQAPGANEEGDVRS